jgi:hypothetical protein
MSRKLILSLSVAAIAAVTLASGAADARGFGGGGARMGGGRASFGGHASFGGRSSMAVRGPIRGSHPFHPVRFGHYHEHGHWIFRGGRWIVDDVVADAPAPVTAATPGPCTCLTKNYTPDGQVVFTDLCTKETASASVVNKSAGATPTPTPAPTDFAGRTYDDYLAAQKKN